MRQRRIGEEPQYHYKQQAAAERQDDTKRHEDIIQAIVTIRTSIDGMAAEHAATRNQTSNHEKAKRYREWSTFSALVAAAVAAIITLIVSHVDNRAIIREARRAADQQHIDTLAALSKTDATIAALKGQADTMREQLTVMTNEKRPWIRTNVSLDDHVTFTDWGGSKGVTIHLIFSLKNYGESPATNIRISAHPVPYIDEIEAIEKLAPEQAKTCSSAMDAANADPIGGFAIFPGDQIPRHTYTALSGLSLFKDKPRQLFAILGCVNYTYADNRHGETGFRYTLGQVVDNMVLGILFQEGTPHPYNPPPSPELFKHGYPVVPPNEAKVGASLFYFQEKDSGNYAK